jgi:hypothetical protein
MGRAEGKRALGRPGCKCEDNIKMYLHEVGREMWTGLCGSGQGQAAGFCECGNQLPCSVYCGEFLD